jgi:transposase
MNENIKKLIEENPDLALLLSEKDHQINSLTQQVDTLKFTLSKFNKDLFGKKSEQMKKDEGVNLFNFNEPEEHQNLNAVEPTIEKVITPKKRHKEQVKTVKQREIIYDLNEEDKTCGDCHSTLVEVGSKTRETIEVIKEAIKVMEKTITYKCPVCNTFHKQESPHLPIEGSIARASLLSQVITDKTANALPLYRQSEDYKRIGLSLSRQTLSNWMIKSSQLLEIIYEHMKQTLLSKDILHADETTVQVLKENGKKASTKSYMWTYVTGDYDNQMVIYEYQPSRAGKHTEAFLSDFKGYLQVDGYKGYNLVKDVTIVGCLAHVRRKFYDIYVTLSEEAKKDSNTKVALDYCNKIYHLDKESKSLSVEDRYAFKQSTIKSIMTEFKAWLDEKSLTCALESSFGKAIVYAINTLPNVMNYLNDGRLSIDNNKAERAIKPFVIGRKNWLFSNTPNGAGSSALLYSITQSCLMNELNPYKYYTYILELLANSKVNELKLDELMPYSEKMITKFHMNNGTD